VSWADPANWSSSATNILRGHLIQQHNHRRGLSRSRRLPVVSICTRSEMLASPATSRELKPCTPRSPKIRVPISIHVKHLIRLQEDKVNVSLGLEKCHISATSSPLPHITFKLYHFSSSSLSHVRSLPQTHSFLSLILFQKANLILIFRF
jgi:hypothetical protein